MSKKRSPSRAFDDSRATGQVSGISNRESAAEESAERAPDESRMDRIAKRAHEIYEARGGQHGKAMEDWLTAERQIDDEIEHSLIK